MSLALRSPHALSVLFGPVFQMIAESSTGFNYIDFPLQASTAYNNDVCTFEGFDNFKAYQSCYINT